MTQTPAADAPWHDENEVPPSTGWYAVQRADGTLCIRGYGSDLWWIPLTDGWLSGIPAGFKWLGPIAPIEWDTPRTAPRAAAAPADAEVKARIEHTNFKLWQALQAMVDANTQHGAARVSDALAQARAALAASSVAGGQQ